jgi:hypothetical protein
LTRIPLPLDLPFPNGPRAVFASIISIEGKAMGSTYCKKTLLHVSIKSRIHHFACLIVFAFSLSGCGNRSDVDLSQVVGTVTLDGQPLAGAVVSFSPDGGRPSTSVTKSDGTYELVYSYDKKGALVGQHIVHITTADGVDESGRSRQKEILPARYHSRTELTAVVEPRRKNVIDFALTSNK